MTTNVYIYIYTYLHDVTAGSDDSRSPEPPYVKTTALWVEIVLSTILCVHTNLKICRSRFYITNKIPQGFIKKQTTHMC